MNQWQINTAKQQDSGSLQQIDVAAVARCSLEKAAHVVTDWLFIL